MLFPIVLSHPFLIALLPKYVTYINVYMLHSLEFEGL